MGRRLALALGLALVLGGCAPKEDASIPSPAPSLKESANASVKGGDIGVNPNGNFNVPTRK